MEKMNEQDLDAVRAAIQEHLSGGNLRFRIPADRGDINSIIYRVGDVIEQTFDENDIIYEVRINRADYEKNGHQLMEFIEK